MIRSRYLHSATLLNNGQVLIIGGYDQFSAATSSAELYTPRVLVPAPVLFSSRAMDAGKAQSGTLRQDRPRRPTILQLPAKLCRCTPPAWLTAV